MQENIPYNLIVLERGIELPFPKYLTNIPPKDILAQYEWHSYGLPYIEAKYSIIDNNLYLTELPNGETKIERNTEFTGKVMIAGFFLNEKEGEDNHFLSFKITFLEGVVIKVELDNCSSQDANVYKQANMEFNKNLAEVMQISNSWWFKYLYRPWFIFVRFVAYVIISGLTIINNILVKFFSLLTPL